MEINQKHDEKEERRRDVLPHFTPANTSTTVSLKENTLCQTSYPGYQ
jgi:hypothetical protein